MWYAVLFSISLEIAGSQKKLPKKRGDMKEQSPEIKYSTFLEGGTKGTE
jgi:hypothetical protein